MDKLPSTIIQHIYEYDNVKQLSAHFFIYNCQICFKPYNNCCCYCAACKAYLKLCQQTFYGQYSTYEDDLNDTIQLGY